jgi:peptidoglycan hydrolase-like protein with peptidoglycan-binding domain
VQRRLTGLGFDTKVTGQFDQNTRAVITRWQAARGYPKSGFLNKLQHKALLSEIVATTSASTGDESQPRRAQRSIAGPAPAPAPAPAHRSAPDPAGAAFIGGVMGGMLGGAFRR